MWRIFTHHLCVLGHIDFTFEVERCLQVLDGAVTLLDGSAGVEVHYFTISHNTWFVYDRPKHCVCGGKLIDIIYRELLLSTKWTRNLPSMSYTIYTPMIVCELHQTCQSRTHKSTIKFGHHLLLWQGINFVVG